MGQTVLLRRREWPDTYIDQQPAYIQPTPFISLALCFPCLYFLRPPGALPFLSYFPSSKHAIISLVQSPGVLPLLAIMHSKSPRQ